MRAAASALALCAMALVLVACSPRTSAPASTADLDLNLPIRFVVQQRTDDVVPGTGGTLRLSLGDITDGQVHATLLSHAAADALVDQPLRAGDVVPFELRGARLQLELVELRSLLIGRDTATFVLSRPGLDALDEMGRIEALLAALQAETSCIFIRNGSEYTAAEAAEHLRDKLALHRSEVRSVEDFIRICASKSSFSGQLYHVRLASGQELTSAESLHDLAGKLGGAR